MSDRLRALFRVDAAPALGGGHVMRCLTLANALCSAGWSVRFAVAEGTDQVVPALKRSAFATAQLTDPFDPEEVCALLPEPADLIVVDHYGLDARYERRLRDRARKILAIDDLVNRPHDCDILLDQTFGRDAIAYKPLVPPGAKVLAGATYALLRPEFAEARERSIKRRRTLTSVDRILISMGLTDLGGITARVLSTVLDICPDKAIDVVLGPFAQSLPAAQAISAAHPNVTIHIDPPSMTALMVAADLAVGAAGTTTWERCCLGLPTIAIVLADNQSATCEHLDSYGAVIASTIDKIAENFATSVQDLPCLANVSNLAAQICDGRGTYRVLDVLNCRLDKTAAKARDSHEWS